MQPFRTLTAVCALFSPTKGVSDTSTALAKIGERSGLVFLRIWTIDRVVTKKFKWWIALYLSCIVVAFIIFLVAFFKSILESTCFRESTHESTVIMGTF